MSNKRNSPCICGSGKKTKMCHPDIHPQSRAGNMLKLYAEFETRKRDYYNKNDIDPPPCTAGCSQCCYHNFFISDIEFKLILEELKKWNTNQLEKLFLTVSEQINYVKTNFPEEYTNLQENGTNKKNIVEKQIKNMSESFGLPCPLLDKESGRCRIYDVRPFICRIHGSSFYINRDYNICDKINSNLENKKRVPDVSDLVEKHTILNCIIHNDIVIQKRKYPIFYWLSLDLKPFEIIGQVIIPERNRDFSIPSEIADMQDIKRLINNRKL